MKMLSLEIVSVYEHNLAFAARDNFREFYTSINTLEAAFAWLSGLSLSTACCMDSDAVLLDGFVVEDRDEAIGAVLQRKITAITSTASHSGIRAGSASLSWYDHCSRGGLFCNRIRYSSGFLAVLYTCLSVFSIRPSASVTSTGIDHKTT